ncbi:MAG: RNA polymerase sigma factor [Planctomycetota bacterium]
MRGPHRSTLTEDAAPATPPSTEVELSAETTRLMAMVKRGDRGAFDHLVRLVRGRAFRVAAGLVGSRDDAIELCQESFLKVYRARETFRDGEPFLPWFHRIVRNTCFSFLRREKRIKNVSIDAEYDDDGGGRELESDPPPGEPTPEIGELRDRFGAAFERLGARDREILVLRHFDELSYRDIARALGIPEGTVMSRLFHARRRLRDALGERFAEEMGAELGAAD